MPLLHAAFYLKDSVADTRDKGEIIREYVLKRENPGDAKEQGGDRRC